MKQNIIERNEKQQMDLQYNEKGKIFTIENFLFFVNGKFPYWKTNFEVIYINLDEDKGGDGKDIMDAVRIQERLNEVQDAEDEYEDDD